MRRRWGREPAARRWVRRGVLSIGGSGLIVGVAASAAAALTTSVPPIQVTLPSLPSVLSTLTGLTSPVTNYLGYQIHTFGGNGCATNRTVNALYGVPTPVDLGGSALPDVVVLVAPIPALPGVNNPTTLNLSVTRLSSAPLPAMVEAIIAPSGQSDPSRVALGYNGCASTAPANFTTQVVSQPTHLSLNVHPSGAGANLDVIAASYTQPASGTTPVNPTTVSLEVAPVPSSLAASVDILPGSQYKAHITSAVATQATLDYLNQSATNTTTAHLTLTDLPTTSDITFSPTGGSYSMSAAVDIATLTVTSVTPGQPTLYVNATATGLPTVASFAEDGPTHASFTTPGTIGNIAVRYASYTGNPTLPPLPTSIGQYLDASITSALTVADVQLANVGSSGVDWGNTVKLDLAHRAGPFALDVTAPTSNPAGAVHVTGLIQDLPANIHVTYNGTTQAATYSGDGVINQMVFDATTTGAPFVGRANAAHLVLTSVPAGLSTALDSAGESFNATMSAPGQNGPVGTLGGVELTLSNGTTRPTPTGDGLVFYDPSPPTPTPPASAPYEVILRASNLHSAAFGWGRPISVDIDHQAAPFSINAQIATGTVVNNVQQVVTIIGTLADLPGVAHVQYYSPIGPPVLTEDIVPLGGGAGGISLEPTDSRLIYKADSAMHSLQLNVDSTTPLTHDANQVRATLTDLPTSLDLDFSDQNSTFTANATITGTPLGRLVASVGSHLDSCPNCLATATDGVNLVDRTDNTEPYLAELHLSGVAGAAVSYDADQVHVNVQTAGGPFTVSTDTQSPDADNVTQTQDVNAQINNLPSDIDLTYATDSQTVTYSASAPISSITAGYHNSPDPIAGGDTADDPGAHYLDASLTGLPATLNLTLGQPAGSPAGSTGFMADTGQLAIGHATLTLSDHLADEPVDTAALGDSNGVLIEDFKKTSPHTAEPYYDIYAQATGLKHIEFSDEPDGQPKNTEHDETLHAHATFDNHDPLLVIDRSDGDASKADDTQYVQASYAAPPEDVDISIDEALSPDPQDDLDAITVTYQGDAVGSGLQFSTNAGAGRTELQAGVDQVPVNLYACVDPSSADCFVVFRPGDRKDESSYKIAVTPLPDGQLTHFTLSDCTNETGRVIVGGFPEQVPLPPSEQVDCDGSEPVPGYEGSLTTADLNIQSELSAHAVTNQSCTPDCQDVDLDTNDGDVNGSLIQGSATDRDINDSHLGIRIPDGFKANRWSVEIGCGAGCTGEVKNPDGKISCPLGMKFNSDALPFAEANFAEELCPKSPIDPISSAEVEHLPPGSVNQFFRLTGKNFSADISPDQVNFGNGIEVSSLTLVGYDELDMCLSVDSNAPTGLHGISLPNPEGINDSHQDAVINIDPNAALPPPSPQCS
jgi:hypothetical protein